MHHVGQVSSGVSCSMWHVSLGVSCTMGATCHMACCAPCHARQPDLGRIRGTGSLLCVTRRTAMKLCHQAVLDRGVPFLLCLLREAGMKMLHAASCSDDLWQRLQSGQPERAGGACHQQARTFTTFRTSVYQHLQVCQAAKDELQPLDAHS